MIRQLWVEPLNECQPPPVEGHTCIARNSTHTFYRPNGVGHAMQCIWFPMRLVRDTNFVTTYRRVYPFPTYMTLVYSPALLYWLYKSLNNLHYANVQVLVALYHVGLLDGREGIIIGWRNLSVVPVLQMIRKKFHRHCVDIGLYENPWAERTRS